jgi:hypothetical protein
MSDPVQTKRQSLRSGFESERFLLSNAKVAHHFAAERLPARSSVPLGDELPPSVRTIARAPAYAHIRTRNRTCISTGNGVDAARIETASMGSEDAAKAPKQWAQDRRVEVQMVP